MSVLWVVPAAGSAALRGVVVDAGGGADEDLAARGDRAERLDRDGFAEQRLELRSAVFDLVRPAFVAGAVSDRRGVADEELDVGDVLEAVVVAAHRFDLLAEDILRNAARHAHAGRDLAVADHRVADEFDVEERFDLKTDLGHALDLHLLRFVGQGNALLGLADERDERSVHLDQVGSLEEFRVLERAVGAAVEVGVGLYVGAPAELGQPDADSLGTLIREHGIARGLVHDLSAERLAGSLVVVHFEEFARAERKRCAACECMQQVSFHLFHEFRETVIGSVAGRCRSSCSPRRSGWRSSSPGC